MCSGFNLSVDFNLSGVGEIPKLGEKDDGKKPQSWPHVKSHKVAADARVRGRAAAEASPFTVISRCFDWI
jgi:hypothetical protein